MAYSTRAGTAARRTRSLPSASASAARALDGVGRGVPRIGITVYGCDPDEAALFRSMGPRFGVMPTITDAVTSEGNADLALGNRCVSVGHKVQVTDSALFALRRAGVEYISTRSVGVNHINVRYAESIGLTVGTVVYSPDSVADYTLMLMLMAVRHAKATVLRADIHDYRLAAVRGKELRDLTIGVIGTGRIGSAVIDRLGGFGCRVLAHDHRPKTSARYVSLDELLQQSDIVTLHTPLTAETHHLIDGRRIAQMKRGAFIVNTGRGSLLDTEALIPALESGRLGGVALDVLEGEEGIFYADWSGSPFENEPLLRLHQLPNVVISPHTAYYTDHALRDTVASSIRNCLEFEQGRTPWAG